MTNPPPTVSMAGEAKKSSCLLLYRLCPKCGKMMIENRKYIECGEMNCDYIEAVIR